jgi:hypothetical protein
MAETPTNPFRNSLQDARPADDSALYPLAAVVRDGGSGLGGALGVKVRDLQFGGSVQLATPRAADLSIKDLNDLAAGFAGVPTSNPKLGQLNLEDLSSLEAVFNDAKIQAAKAVRHVAVSGAAVPLISDAGCCSCCTPCCCCAASEPVPFDAACEPLGTVAASA